MKRLIHCLLLAVPLGLVGCVATVTETKPGPKPAYRDRVENRYAKSVDEVFAAARQAINSFGNVTRDGNLLVATNQVRTVEGFINGNAVFIRIEGVDSNTTTAVVQVRTKMGSTNLRMAADVVRQVSVYLE